MCLCGIGRSSRVQEKACPAAGWAPVSTRRRRQESARAVETPRLQPGLQPLGRGLPEAEGHPAVTSSSVVLLTELGFQTRPVIRLGTGPMMPVPGPPGLAQVHRSPCFTVTQPLLLFHGSLQRWLHTALCRPHAAVPASSSLLPAEDPLQKHPAGGLIS